MLWYGLIACALFLYCAIASLTGLSPFFALVAFSVPVGVYVARRRTGLAVGLIASVAAAASLTLRSVVGVLCFAGVAVTGFPLGLGIIRRASYGRIVAAVAGLAFAVQVVFLAAAWEEWQAQFVASFEGFVEMFERGAGQGDAQTDAIARKGLQWLKKEGPNVSLGLFFFTPLTGSCVAVSTASWWMRRRHGEPGPKGSFRAMRTPAWLVWLVILAAAGWFVDRTWPDAVLRFVTWNVLTGLAAIYWLNGLCVVVYALDALRPHLVVYIAALLVLPYCGLYPVLGVGLFDTWGDFRRRVDQLVAARKEREDSRNDKS